MRRIRASTSQETMKTQLPIRRIQKFSYAVLKINSNNILEYYNRGPHSKKLQYAIFTYPIRRIDLISEDYKYKTLNTSLGNYSTSLRKESHKQMAEPVLEEYITITRKNYISDNDRWKIVEKSFLELKVTFLVKIRDNAFSGTNGEDAVEHFEKILKVVGPLKIRNVSEDRFRLGVFPILLTGAASDWFKEECLGSITSWEDLTKKFFEKYYPPSRTNMEMKADEDEVSWDQTNIEFENWLVSKFKNYITMDCDTMYAMCKYWRMESNKEVKNDNEPCIAFDEFNYLFQIDPNVLTKDIPEFKTYEEYKDDWIYEWNDKIPWVNEKPWKLDGIWKEPTLVKHRCKPLIFKSRHSEWPACNWRDDEYCNRGNLPKQFQVGNTIQYQDYEWYEALEDSELKEEALRNKAALEESMNQDEESSNGGWSNYSPIDE
ncbi:hypothetical protein Tco_0789031 [Tanacetum coccineum]